MWWYNDTCTRAGGRCQYMRNGRPPNNLAFFEFAPSSGAGMGSACACAPITGARGETLTFTRTGNATCSKQGLATTGILNGDLVVCAGDQPRVEASGGVLGLRVEGARTNETLRSQEFESVVWATTVSGVAAPVITANFATAPDGTLTADRMQIPACPVVGNASGINQTSATIASPSTSSVYMKANAGNPSISVCMYGITTGTRTCTQYALNTSTWTRAIAAGVTNTGGMNLEIACENRTASYTGATNTGAADILVWGAQSEAGAYATSYIPTAAGSITRSADIPYFARSVATTAGVCVAATVQTPSTLAFPSSGLYAPVLSSGSTTAVYPYMWPFTAAPGASLAIDALGSSGAPASYTPASDNPTTFSRYVAGHNGTAYSYCVDGTCRVNGATSAWASPTYSHIKLDIDGSTSMAHIFTRVQVDPDFTRCTR